MRVVAVPSNGAAWDRGSARNPSRCSGLRFGRESGQGVAERLGRLAHHGASGDEPERVERDFGAVAVGVGQPERLQDPVVVLGDGAIAHGVVRLEGGQHVGVAAGRRNVAEGIAGAMCREEVALGKGQLVGRRVGLTGGIEHPPRWDPPGGRVVAANEAAVDQGRVVDASAVDVRQQAGGERQPEALPGQRQRLEHAQRQQVGQVVSAVDGPHPLDQALLRDGRIGRLLVGDRRCAIEPREVVGHPFGEAEALGIGRNRGEAGQLVTERLGRCGMRDQASGRRPRW